MNFHEPRILRRKDFIRQDGLSQIYLQVVIDKRKKKINLGIYTSEIDWDEDEMRVRSSHNYQREYNMIIASAVGKSMDILVEAAIHNKGFTVDDFERHFVNFEARQDFIKWMRLKCQDKIGDVAESTYCQHVMYIDKFEKFKKQLTFNQLTLPLLKEFDIYMKTTCNNNANTRHKNFKYLNYYINRAIESGIKFENPFKAFVWPTTSNRVVFLDAEECKKLYNYYLETDNVIHKKHLKIWFLMMSTGLRVSDALTVTNENIYGNMLVFTPKKTAKKGHAISIPITAFAKQFMDIEARTLAGVSIYSQSIITGMKKIAKLLKIKKNVTNHCARHTFATQFLMNGGDILSLQKILDHSDINDTMVYEHITNEFKTQKMNSAFDLFFDGLKKNN